MVDPVSAWIAIGCIALVTYLTRFAGIWIMDYIPLTKRMERGLEALVGSVFIAFVVPALWKGDLGVKLATVAAFAVMLITRKVLAAITVGAVVAVLARNYIG
jgi:uncharacterized membrane protein